MLGIIYTCVSNKIKYNQMHQVYNMIFLFFGLVILHWLISPNIDNFEQVKIKLKPNPLNLNINNVNGGTCGTYPDVIVPIYAGWKSYWPASSVYPYYPFYPFYYNNYYL